MFFAIGYTSTFGGERSYALEVIDDGYLREAYNTVEGCRAAGEGPVLVGRAGWPGGSGGVGVRVCVWGDG